MTQKMIDEMMSNPNLIEKYAGNKRKLKRDIKKKQKKNPIDESIIQESYAKQYLKMVCNCIYKKVDESSEDKKEKAYKSFHILSEYLENKGVTELFILARETIRFLVKIWCYSEKKKLCQLKIQ